MTHGASRCARSRAGAHGIATSRVRWQRGVVRWWGPCLIGACLSGLALHCGSRSGLERPDDASDGGVGTADASLPDGFFVDDSGQLVHVLPDGRTVLADGGPTGCDDLTTSQNCGACGHDCFGGACAVAADGGRVCQPVVLTDQESFPNTLTVDDARVFWGNRTDADYGSPPSSIQVRAMPKHGGAPTTLETITPGVPTSMQREANYLYFYRSIEWTVRGQAYVGSIVRMCVDGTCKRTDLSGAVDDDPWQMAIDDTRIFFPTSLTGGMSQIPKQGGAPTAMAPYTSFFFTRFAVDRSYVYVFAVPNDTVAQTMPVMVLRSGKEPTSSAEPLMKGLVEGGDVIVDDEALYVSDTRAIYRLPKTGADAWQPSPLTSPGVAPGLLAQDAQRIYWLDGDRADGTPSMLRWVFKKGGGEGAIVLPNQATKTPGLVLDDASIYWVATLAPLLPPVPARGAIMRCTKPL